MPSVECLKLIVGCLLILLTCFYFGTRPLDVGYISSAGTWFRLRFDAEGCLLLVDLILKYLKFVIIVCQRSTFDNLDFDFPFFFVRFANKFASASTWISDSSWSAASNAAWTCKDMDFTTRHKCNWKHVML